MNFSVQQSKVIHGLFCIAVVIEYMQNLKKSGNFYLETIGMFEYFSLTLIKKIISYFKPTSKRRRLCI